MGNCSVGTAQSAIVNSYKHGINGFSAMLTEAEAAKLSGNLFQTLLYKVDDIKFYHLAKKLRRFTLMSSLDFIKKHVDLFL